MTATSFQPTADDLVAANRAFFVWSLRRPGYWRTMLAVGLGVGGIGVLLVWRQAPMLAWPAGGAILGAWIGAMAALNALQWLLIPRRSRRIFVQQRALHEPVSLDWSAEGVHLVSGRGEARFAWRDFHARHRGRDTVLLLQSEALFIFVPTRVLTREQATDLAHGWC